MIFLYILGIVLAILIILVLVAPKHYDVQRSVYIDRPVAEVYNYLKSVKNQDHWSPWKKKDPGMHQEFVGTDGTVGFVSKWDSDHKQVGAGQQEITALAENERVDTHITFLKPFKSESDGYLLTKPEGQGTKVTWGFTGTHTVPMNVMMLFFNMDKAVGKDFEEGLADLKQLLEQNP
ncbi:SRPBCC family protein [Marinirhabdus gelatinilytica]|uniref:Polyketide cyclase/dehydrase/lipid transport protein n=1 Tax=Marinirhabdus gelatinilytica TaxID=1703343 RepID=A0A370QFQ5_9FLAO|nr:SRPBCC family protein [Marinirhabdus gelatinilytica]RDK87197.1 polyketide cyclase/dehydrase/lipid transport protein [Marinirhabdus gelatinilytica]